MPRIMGLLALAAVVLLSDVAFAANARVNYTEPGGLNDLASCRVFVRNAQAAVIVEETFPASSATGGQARVADLVASLNALETGKEVLVRCVDVNGNLAADSNIFQFNFPAVAPGAATVTGVSIVP